MSDAADPADDTPPDPATTAWLERMRARQRDSWQRLTEQQAKAEERFESISREVFDDIMGAGEKKEPAQ